MSAPAGNAKFEALLDYLQRSRGFDFTGYKRPSLMRRVLRRMQVINLEDFGDYQDYLEVHPEEFIQLFNTILINVTGLFRDAAAWEFLAREVVPRLLQNRNGSNGIRIWCAGCASGEEAYSLAMLLAEALGINEFRQQVKLYATDVDEEALAQARHASYPARDLEAVAPELREKYFESQGDRWVFRPDLRRSVIFGRLDLVQDAPISRLDLLACRNTLMYFNAQTQAEILSRFHFALKDHGYLFLGKAEMLLSHGALFKPVDFRHRIFAKMPNSDGRERAPLTIPANHGDSGSSQARRVRLRDAAFEAMPLPQLVVDINGNLALANAQARAFLELGSRAVGRPFSDLQISYKPAELRSLIERAYKEKIMVPLVDVQQRLADGSTRWMDIQLTPLLENGVVLGVSVSFLDKTDQLLLHKELERSNQELETAYEELQSSNEEMQTTNEELQSTNEELETTNEELQSSNEEMETMNEELQSTNEELRAANEQLRERTSELNRLNAYLESILACLRAAVVVVDPKLQVQSWNSRAEDLWGLRRDEVLGKPLHALDIGLPTEQLTGAIRASMAGEKSFPESLLDARNRRGKTIKCRVTCAPLLGRSEDHQGVILLMEEAEP